MTTKAIADFNVAAAADGYCYISTSHFAAICGTLSAA
jgi:hypothetical protein